MRYVDCDFDKLELPEGWRDKVSQLNADLIAEPDEAKRNEIIENNSDVWREVKPALAKVLNGKCWYTESKQEGTDTDVDHFRPKKRVAEIMAKGKGKSHSGYWWLAFQLSNYRYSCIFANRRRRDLETDKTGGKADHFPILNEDCRAWTPQCDCDEEQPMLLDPCKASDAALITFKEDGEAMPRHDERRKPRLYERASTSIDLYNINHSDFVKARIALRDEMADLVKDAEKYYRKLDTGDATHAHAFERAVKQLMDLQNKKAAYSSFCVAYLDKFRHEEFLAGIFY